MKEVGNHKPRLVVRLLVASWLVGSVISLPFAAAALIFHDYIASLILWVITVTPFTLQLIEKWRVRRIRRLGERND